ncbi:MAG: GNAT family N-acetyltransferase, partial [Firmicutes bacterium]|nr:GNAT family N-acetyltransferase [Bacillota bacterium]
MFFQEDELAGLFVMSLPKKHEAYIGGLRIAPSLQQQGLEREIVAHQLEEARRLGAQVCRVLVSQNNELLQKVVKDDLHLEKNGTWIVADWEGYQAPQISPVIAGPAWAVDKDRLERFAERFSNELWSENDLWIPRSLDAKDVAKRFEDANIAVAPQDSADDVESLAIYRIDTPNDRM